MFVTHHRHIIKAIHITNRLIIRFRFRQLFSRAMQQPNMWISTLNNFAIQLQYQTQHAMRRRVLRAKIHSVIADFCHAGRVTENVGTKNSSLAKAALRNSPLQSTY